MSIQETPPPSRVDVATLSHPADARRALEAIGQWFRDTRDLHRLQQRCEAFVGRFTPDAWSRDALTWIATQAELIECRLIADRVESLDEALQRVATRFAAA